MTKKDFKLIAEVRYRTLGTRTQLARAFADALAATNPRFDAHKFFVAALGYDPRLDP